MFYELARLSIGNLLRARARLVMTAGGVLVGTCAVILLIALTIGLQTAAEAGIGQSGALTEIQVWPNYGFGPRGPETSEEEGEPPKLSVEAVNQFWRIPGVAAVIPMVNLQVGGEIMVGDYRGYGQIIGISPQLLPYLGVSAAQGVLSLEEGQVLVGARVSENFYDPSAEEWQPVFVDLFNEPDVRMVINQWNSPTPQTRKLKLNVVGTLAESGGQFDYSIIMPIQEVIKHNEWGTGQEFDPKTFVYDQVTVKASDRETTNEVTEVIRDMGYSAGGMGDFLNQLNSFFGTMRLMLGGIGGVALLVAAFGVANTMTMAILERTKEIGLMKAIGATDKDVLTVFLIEAGLVGFCGGASGVMLSIFLQNLINQAIANLPTGEQGGGIMFLPFDPSQIGGNLMIIPSELMFFAIALATAVGLGAGLFPALRAARLQPVIALKSE